VKAPVIRRVFAALYLCAVLPWSGIVSAQDYPNRALRIVVPVAAGNSSDAIFRWIADRLAERLGQPFIVENRPGGDSIIATLAVLNAPADGYSILMMSPSVVVAQLTNSDVKFDVERDFRLLTMLSRGAGVIVAAPNSKFTTVEQLLAEARGNPGMVSLATYSQSFRMGALTFGQQANATFNQISYKGFTQATTDVIGGTVDTALVDIGAAIPLIKAGKLRALATTATTRLPKIADVPTMKERGLPNYDMYIWVGLAVRSQTPEPAVKRLERELAVVLNSQAYRNFRAERSDSEILSLIGKDAMNDYAREIQRYRATLKSVETQAR
jgi:tripartite-type tricarboxylate transporter receptor subunit TctC